MKAAVFHGLSDVRCEEVPVPEPGPEEILVEMKACGICGSDLMDWYLRARAPLVLGHEPSGVVAEVGDRVAGFAPGDRVFVHHHVACLSCHYCVNGSFTVCDQFRRTNILPGGLAEFFRVPSRNVKVDTLRIPDVLSFEEATLLEPIACCLRALGRCRLQMGDTVLVIGAGPSGAIHVMISRGFGAARVIVSDFVDYRLEVARKLGADLVINPRNENLVHRVMEATDGRGADIVVVTAPNVKAFSEALDVCRRGGTVSLFAPTPPDESIGWSPYRLFFSEISIVPSYSASHVETRAAMSLLASGRIPAKELITHRFPLGRVDEAFQMAAEGKNCMKVVVVNDRDRNDEHDLHTQLR